jgi:cytochrome c oxidase cbb3-type subunit III
MNLRKLMSVTGFLVILWAACLGAAAQGGNPYADNAEAAKRGAYQFRINCSFCHGLNARGGGRGPDLTRSNKRHGDSDGELFRTISEGVAGTAMPANGTTLQGVGMTDEEIWQIITYLRSVEVKAPPRPLGDSTRGQELFGSSGCHRCHMVRGKGGRLGPDLTAIAASRSVDYLIESIRNPSQRLAEGLLEPTKEFPQEYESVTVVTHDGKELAGVVLNEDSFSLQMMDESEQLHSLDKQTLRSMRKSRVSLMPSYNTGALSERDLRDIIAYLQSMGKKREKDD